MNGRNRRSKNWMTKI